MLHVVPGSTLLDYSSSIFIVLLSFVILPLTIQRPDRASRSGLGRLADQELLLIFPESGGPPHILIVLVVFGKTQEIYSNNNNNNNNILILIIRTK
jgi:hypothetical protein